MRKHAFTMLELVFVIMIIGIIGTIGANILRVMYDNYYSSAVNNQMQANTELALQQIGNRLQYRLRDSVIVAPRTTAPGFRGVSDTDVADQNYTRIEWIGYDIDGWLGNGNGNPTWSGFIDVDAIDTANADFNTLHSPGSDDANISAVIEALSPSIAANGINNAAIFYTGANTDVEIDYGWYRGSAITDQNGTAAHRIVAGGNPDQFDSIATDDFNGTAVFEQYKLSWTAYALSVENDNGRHNLYLYYDYRPWSGDIFSDGSRRLLLQNVSSAQAQAIGDILKVQICVDNNISGLINASELYSICKERVIF
jgi:prepilin-type N-terminal cleavage/methylation domain-containing protein